MRNLSTAGGHLFFASIHGSPATLQDTMVAASVYVRSLEEQFSTAQQLLACFAAWAEDAEQGPDTLSAEQLKRAKKWMEAHEHADRVARPWLSDPTRQKFSLRVPGMTHLRIAP